MVSHMEALARHFPAELDRPLDLLTRQELIEPTDNDTQEGTQWIHNKEREMITTKVMPVRDVRQQMSRLLDEAEADGELVMITRHGRPAGYLIGYETLNRLLRRLEDLEDMRAMREAEVEWRAGGGQPFTEALAEIEAEEAATQHITRELVPDTPVEVLIPESAREESKEQAFLKRLVKEGLLASKVSWPEEAPFEPVHIEGPPLSQTIIEERR